MNMKNFLKVLFLFVIFVCTCNQTFSQVNEQEYIQQGYYFLNKVEENKTPELNDSYIKRAQYYFYVASKQLPPPSEAIIGLGRV